MGFPFRASALVVGADVQKAVRSELTRKLNLQLATRCRWVPAEMELAQLAVAIYGGPLAREDKLALLVRWPILVNGDGDLLILANPHAMGSDVQNPVGI